MDESTKIKAFATCVVDKTSSVTDRGVALLYFRSLNEDYNGATISELASDFGKVGWPAPNQTRLKSSLGHDKRTMKIFGNKWKIRSDRLPDIEAKFGTCTVSQPKINTETDSIIPRELLKGTRGYLEEIVRQINGCYDTGFFDASGVMVRRLIETLIIEFFEEKKLQNNIKDSTGEYLMLNNLITATLAESSVSLGRNAKKGLVDAKWLGDQSAHNRRFLATKPDIDKVQQGIRILVQELVTLAFPKK
jgi:hypothetical protein